MVATQFTGSERRALRWMRRRGLGLHPSESAFGVLTARLDIRVRAGLAVWPAFLALFAWWQFATTPDAADEMSPWWQAVRTVGPVALFGVALAGFTVWCTRADRRIARGMPARVTRTGAVPAHVVLGPLAVRSYVLVGALEVTTTVLLATRAGGVDAVTFGGGCAAVWAISSAVLRVVLHRPTVALDTSALAVDERLRALDALYALWPVGWAGLALITPLDLRGVHGSGLIVALAGAAMVASFVSVFSHPAERVRYGFGGYGSRA